MLGRPEVSNGTHHLQNSGKFQIYSGNIGYGNV